MDSYSTPYTVFQVICATHSPIPLVGTRGLCHEEATLGQSHAERLRASLGREKPSRGPMSDGKHFFVELDCATTAQETIHAVGRSTSPVWILLRFGCTVGSYRIIYILINTHLVASWAGADWVSRIVSVCLPR